MVGASVVKVVAGGGGTRLDAPGNASLIASLTPDELAEIREYGKLVRFRDAVVNGLHPRIKPSHLPGKVAQSQPQPSTSASTTSTVPKPSKAAAAKSAGTSGRPVIDNLQSPQASKQPAQVNMASGVPGLGTLSSAPSSQKPQGAGKPEINPVLLEKSDDLIKAEIQLQRQRVERSLKEQLEQRRAVNKASEQLAELDVADIMAKAMSLVHATPPIQSTDDTAANASASNDSADDDTFYSSRHDTPESNMASRLPNESEDEEMREGSPYEPELDFEPVAQPQAQRATSPTQVAPSGARSQPSQQAADATAPVQAAPAATVTVPGLSIGTSNYTTVYQPQVAEASGALPSSSGSRLEGLHRPGSAEKSGTHDLAGADGHLPNQALVRDPPLVRGHDLSPLAPQPTHILPQAIAREPQLAATEPSGGPQAAPAQVAALRKQPSNGSSPESSPHSSKAAEKKKKKKKRKADRLAADTAAASPYIKPEPRSPSPLTPQYARPNKRQRYSQQQPLEIHDDEPRYEPRMPAEEGYQERYQPRVVRQERVVGYERADEYRPHHAEEPILITSPRYERVYYDDYRAPPPSGYATGPESTQYLAREVRTVRPASRVVEGPYEDTATYYHDVRAASRMGVRPPAYPERSQSPVGYERPLAAMPPPRAPPRRIIVDAFGREYLEPVRPATVVREEVVPDPRGAYERALPPRAISRRPEPLDDDAVLYHPTSPVYAAPRRVVTQPEYSYRETAGPSNPMALPPAEHPREYISRPSSVRPPIEATRYDSGPSGYERLAAPIDDRPPPPPRDYYRAASARPAAGDGTTATRYEVPAAYEHMPASATAHYPAPPPLRSASVRPAADSTVRYETPREYGARRVEYAPAPNVGAASAAVGYYPDVRRETMPPPPPARAYSVMPPGEVRREYAGLQQPQQQQPPVDRYYGRPPPPQPGREDEEVVFLERGQVMREGYR